MKVKKLNEYIELEQEPVRFKENINEKVRWYNKGKLENGESFDVDEFQVGDMVVARRNYYWDDENYGYGELENVGIKGEWVNNLVTTRGRISEINTIENAKGYSGQLIKLMAHWPWFQITNFEKV